MAKMMLRSSLPLTVWARRAEALDPFVAEGAQVAETPAQLAAMADVLSICVTADEDVKEVVHGCGVLAALKPGSVLAIHSTVLPSLSIDLAKQAERYGVEVLDAPVSGSSRGAFAKTLLVMVGGSALALERAMPAFQSYGNPILHIGGCGAAMTSKLINNLVAIAQKGIAVRALLAASSFGLDPNVVQRVVLAGVGRSTALEIVGRLQDAQRARHIWPLVKKDILLARKALPSKELDPLFALADEAIDWIDRWACGTGRVLDVPKAL
jgi:3-hydroxyisobutyrate dehydrogenase